MTTIPGSCAGGSSGGGGQAPGRRGVGSQRGEVTFRQLPRGRRGPGEPPPTGTGPRGGRLERPLEARQEGEQRRCRTGPVPPSRRAPPPPLARPPPGSPARRPPLGRGRRGGSGRSPPGGARGPCPPRGSWAAQSELTSVVAPASALAAASPAPSGRGRVASAEESASAAFEERRDEPGPLPLSPPSAASASPASPSGLGLWPRELERPLWTGGPLETPPRETVVEVGSRFGGGATDDSDKEPGRDCSSSRSHWSEENAAPCPLVTLHGCTLVIGQSFRSYGPALSELPL